MAPLPRRDASALLDVLHELYACRDLDALRQAAPLLVKRLVPCDVAAYTEIDLPHGHIVSTFDTPEATEEIGRLHFQFERYAYQHPCVQHYQKVREGPPVKISDFLTLAEYRRLEIYNEFYGRFGLSRQMIVALPPNEHMLVGVAANRTRRDFTERERRLLDQFRLNLRQAHQNAQETARLQEQAARAARVVEALGAFVLPIDGEGRIVQSSPVAEALLAGYFPRPRAGAFLADRLRDWVRTQAARLRPRADDTPPPQPMILRLPDRQLLLRLIPDARPERFLLVLQERREPTPAMLKQFGLTDREAEVLFYVAHGKTNEQIAQALALRPPTVKTHVERILSKLGVRTRTQAAAAALRHLLASAP